MNKGDLKRKMLKKNKTTDKAGKFVQSQNIACLRRYLETDDYGQVRTVTDSRTSVSALAELCRNKNTPHHTCKASASCLPQANASCSNAALHTAEPVPDCSLVPVVERQQSKKSSRLKQKCIFQKKKCIYFC